MPVAGVFEQPNHITKAGEYKSKSDLIGHLMIASRNEIECQINNAVANVNHAKYSVNVSGTFINEALAKALAKRFFDEVETRFYKTINCRDFRDMFFHKNIHKSRKRWKIQSKRLEKIIGQQPSHFYKCGSNSKPAFVASIWDVEEINGRGFDEPVLVCKRISSQYTNMRAHREISSCAPMVITKHTLARIFQRIPEARKMVTDWSFEWVASVIAPVLTWSGFWVERSYSRLLKLKDIMTFESKIKPIIPSEYGLFICEIDAGCDQPLVVKTFVNTDQLREKQIVVRDIMIEAVRDLDALRLPLSPLVV
ncbi:MAG: hypothetical protein P8N92_09105, partial [Burkholderiales bacterium]|nr:hypothetical protein [Burkholderiales bacterium]